MIDAADILKASILIVDDQAANVSLLEKVLRGAGYVSITSTTDPRAVCELHRQHRYSLILLDLQMPGLDGFQVMEGLKAIETDSYLPVLVITAQPDHKLRALKAGAKDFVSKPFDLAEVLMQVRNMLEVRLLHLKIGTRAEQAEMRTELVESRSVQAIQASELRYRRLFETAPDGILILDADTGQVVDANPFMKDLLGYSQADFLGRKLWEIGPFKGEAASKIAFAELQQKDRIHYEGLPLETKDGRRVEVEFISNAYLVDQKRLIQCNIRDITQRKRAAAELVIANKELVFQNEEKEKRAAEMRRMVTVVRDSNDAITIQDFEGRITAWNRGAERMYGYGEAEALAMNIERLTAPGKVAEQKDFVRRLLAGEAVTSLETQRLTKDGRVLDVWMTVTKLMDDTGKPMAPTTYVIFETGCAPVRDQIRIDIPINVSKVSYASAAFPTLKLQDNFSRSLTVTAEGTNFTTELVANMDNIITRNYKNNLPVTISKTVNDATLGRPVNLADASTWATLPKEFQVARIPTPANRRILLTTPDGIEYHMIIDDGYVNVVYVKSIKTGTPLLVSQFKLRH